MKKNEVRGEECGEKRESENFQGCQSKFSIFKTVYDITLIGWKSVYDTRNHSLNP
jgi:hypothetical protein